MADFMKNLVDYEHNVNARLIFELTFHDLMIVYSIRVRKGPGINSYGEGGGASVEMPKIPVLR